MNDERSEHASSIEGRRKPLRDVDSTARTQLLHALAWLGPVGVVFFAAVTYASLEAGAGLLHALLVGISLGLAGPLLVFALYDRYVIGGTASLLSRLYGGGTTGTPAPPTYWRAQALSARGSHLEALRALEAEIAQDPDGPEAYLRAAALCTAELGDPESAIGWYRRARLAKRITPDTDAYVLMRLAALYESTGNERRAMVELRCILERHPESRYAGTARTRLAELKRGWIESGELDSRD